MALVYLYDTTPIQNWSIECCKTVYLHLPAAGARPIDHDRCMALDRRKNYKTMARHNRPD